MVNKPIKVTFDNVAICVTDIDRSIEWYSAVLGFKMTYRTYITTVDCDFVIMERDDFKVEFLHKQNTARSEEMIVGPHLSASGYKCIIFRTDDLEEVTTQLESMNIPLVWRLETISSDGLKATMFRDPDGHLVEVLQYPDHAVAAEASPRQQNARALLPS